jgi:DNA-binding response OmpR family regulator
MNPDRREQIRRFLASLAQSYTATMELMEQTLDLLCEELDLDPWSYFQRRQLPQQTRPDRAGLVVDPAQFSVCFGGKVCFLGNTLPFRLLARLARRPGAYVPYEDLLEDVWQGVRSDAAVRSVAKTLRQKLRQAGLGEVADALDGAVAGHYALRLPP